MDNEIKLSFDEEIAALPPHLDPEDPYKRKGKELVTNVSIIYDSEDPDRLGLFLRMMHKIGHKLGVKVI